MNIEELERKIKELKDDKEFVSFRLEPYYDGLMDEDTGSDRKELEDEISKLNIIIDDMKNLLILKNKLKELEEKNHQNTTNYKVLKDNVDLLESFIDGFDYYLAYDYGYHKNQ